MKTTFAFILFCIVISASAQLPPQGLSATKPLSSLQPFAINTHPDPYPAEKKSLDSVHAYPVEQLIRQMKPIRKETGRVAVLHPSLGNVITPDEKKEFGLFADQPDSTFENAQLIKYNDSTYTILFHLGDGRESERLISNDEILALYLQVEDIKPAPLVSVTAAKKEPHFGKVPEQLIDVCSVVLNASGRALLLLAELAASGNHSSHTNDPSKYDPTQSYLTYPQEHYIPKEGEEDR